MNCNKNHRYLPEYNHLNHAQGNQYGGRHKCSGCAYEKGYDDGSHNRPRSTDMSSLPESQAGTVRQKDALQAYNEGYDEGKRRSS